jgi:hypothetical protein
MEKEKKDTTTRFDFIDTDKRIIDQKLRRHQISHSEHQRILKGASDDKDLAEDLVVYKESEAGDSAL